MIILNCKCISDTESCKSTPEPRVSDYRQQYGFKKKFSLKGIPFCLQKKKPTQLWNVKTFYDILRMQSRLEHNTSSNSLCSHQSYNQKLLNQRQGKTCTWLPLAIEWTTNEQWISYFLRSLSQFMAWFAVHIERSTQTVDVSYMQQNFDPWQRSEVALMFGKTKISSFREPCPKKPTGEKH